MLGLLSFVTLAAFTVAIFSVERVDSTTTKDKNTHPPKNTAFFWNEVSCFHFC